MKCPSYSYSYSYPLPEKNDQHVVDLQGPLTPALSPREREARFPRGERLLS